MESDTIDLTTDDLGTADMDLDTSTSSNGSSSSSGSNFSESGPVFG